MKILQSPFPRFFVLAAFLVVVLQGCYLPVRFDAEIELDRQGFYKMIFNGYMADTSLYAGLIDNKITPAEEREEADKIRRDFERDSATKEWEYIREGHFKVHWEKEGDLLRSKFVSFFRRNENLFSIRYVKTSGLIILEGTPISRTNAERINDAGLRMEGELRLITNARVVRDNADEKKPWELGKTMYIWKIQNVFQPAPKLVISMR